MLHIRKTSSKRAFLMEILATNRVVMEKDSILNDKIRRNNILVIFFN